MKLFCGGVGANTPDITNASRRIKQSEFDLCTGNGVTVTEVRIGFDGIVLANTKSTPAFELTKAQIFLALAQKVPVDGKLVDNPNARWSDIDPSLPDTKIEVLGPPPTSGTRDAFVELALEGGCKTYDFIEAMKKSDNKAYQAVCHTVREDGAYVEAGENDNLIPPSHARRMVEEAGPRAKLVVVEGGNHVANNVWYRYRPQSADWLASQLIAG